MSSSREELALNATQWAETIKRALPREMGFVFILVPKNGVGQGQGVCTSNLNKRGVLDEIKSIQKKFGEQNLIISPFDT